jgi:integrase
MAQSHPNEYVSTRWPGIYKRNGRHVARVRLAGRLRQKTFDTCKAARDWRTQRLAEQARGEFALDDDQPFAVYARDWIERYRGRRGGFTPETRAAYRRDLENYAIPYFDGQLARTLRAITPGDVDRWIAWLCDPGSKRGCGRTLTDATIVRIVAPLRACLESAYREELIRRNPASRAGLPHREASEADNEDDEPQRVFGGAELAALLNGAADEYRVLLELLAGTGLRIGEALALKVTDLRLDATAPHVRVRRSLTAGGRVKATKNRKRRDVPLSPSLVRTLRAHLLAIRPTPSGWLFPSKSAADTPIRATNARRHVLRPAVEAAGLSWDPGFHTFRRTYASMRLARGENLLTVARLLGDTVAVVEKHYAHLLPDAPPPGLDLDDLREHNANTRDDNPADSATVEPLRAGTTGSR